MGDWLLSYADHLQLSHLQEDPKVMIESGTTIIVKAVQNVTRPRWMQDDEGQEELFEVICHLDGSTDAYAWYDTNKGKLIVYEHDKIAVL
jgi:hypothetical protein